MKTAGSAFVVLLIAQALVTNPAAGQTELADRKIISEHLEKIAGARYPGVDDEHLAAVTAHIKGVFEMLGYEIELHPFDTMGAPYRNIIARKQGTSQERIIVGAHFDSVAGSPGADDNASGVSVMLELARILAGRKWNHTVEFIAFHLEEWGMLGSAAYVKSLKREKAEIRGMISLEMVGFISNRPKSQNLPPGFSVFYPDVGNFIGLVGNARSIKLLNHFKSEMKKTDGLPVESLIMPFNGFFLPATRLSDHSPFWDAGYPALLVTDTSFYRNPHYHGPTDTVETLDFDFMRKVTDGVARALIALDEK